MTTDQRFLGVGVHLLPDDAAGVAGITLWPIGSLQLSVLTFDARSGVAAPELIARAAAARRALLDRQTFIAVRYGFTARSEAEAAAKCQALIEGWERQLRRFRGSVEVTLKAGAGGQPRPVAAEAGSGREYLLALHRQRTSIGLPEEFRMAAEEMLGSIAAAWKWQNRDDGAWELCAVLPRERMDEVSEIGNLLKTRFGDVPFLLSGPWPLETFASE